MKTMDIKNKVLWGTSMVGLMGISYWLYRFSFFEMHGMKQWPNILAILGVIVIVIATIFGNRIISGAAVVGYVGGFILAMIFKTYGVDQGGGTTNNNWIIWGTVFIISILIAFIIDFILKQAYKKERD
ncbi:hypothetical protein KQI38_17130 [Tissierella carlieri]|uniref:hypothetical protein n=1 Tax=Tissierella carlieri TaxID=689904 RepID=UPI001C0FFFFA|nr:hypothetical protein [Tissierella carlieri]MBU5313750.1 hypothetical protein [Tissierella carlieri]